jgi:hypothetical protein
MKKPFGVCTIFAVAIIFTACGTTAPAVPPFSVFESYPDADSTLVYFTTVSGIGVEYMYACIITNPDDLENVSRLNYANIDPASMLSTWQNQYNAVTIASNMRVLRTDVAMFNLPKDIRRVGVLLVGGSVGTYHTVQHFVLEIDPETARQGFMFTLNVDSVEQKIFRFSGEEIEREYNSPLYKRYGWQKVKDRNPQVGFIVM